MNDAWQGSVQFWELVFGTWLAYGFLVLMWEQALRENLVEWRYVMITFLGASFYWINHYFQQAPFYAPMLYGYTLLVWVAYYWTAVRGRGSFIWTVLATLSFVAFTVAFIGFEQLARFLWRRFGVHEFWFMLASYFGFLGLILWRGAMGRYQGRQEATALEPGRQQSRNAQQ